MSNRNFKVLVVDDFGPKRKIMKTILERIGFNNIEEANDGIKALTKLKNGNNYNLVITDTKMPNLDGFGLLKELRCDANFNDTPIMLLIDETEEDKLLDELFSLEYPFAEGINNYLIKPVDTESLKIKLDEILAFKSKESIEASRYQAEMLN